MSISNFARDYDGHTGKRIHIPEYDEALHIQQFDLFYEMTMRLPEVGFNRCWRSIPPGAKLTIKVRLASGRKSYRQAMYRDRMDDLEMILRQPQKEK